VSLSLDSLTLGTHADISPIFVPDARLHACFAPTVKQVWLRVTLHDLSCSVLLLPGARQSSSDLSTLRAATAGQKQGAGKTKPAVKAVQSSRLEWQQHMGGSKTGKADGAKKAQLVDPELLTWPYADLQTGNEMPGTFLLSAKSRNYSKCTYVHSYAQEQ